MNVQSAEYSKLRKSTRETLRETVKVKFVAHIAAIFAPEDAAFLSWFMVKTYVPLKVRNR